MTHYIEKERRKREGGQRGMLIQVQEGEEKKKKVR